MTHPPSAVVRALDTVEPVTVPRCRGASLKVLLGPESGHSPGLDGDGPRRA
jgi:hypothetical protein